MTRQHDNPQWQANHSAGQQKIKRTCKCGRVIVGNAAWHSHLSVGRPDCSDYHAYFGWSATTDT